jgi:hypothetical protein
VNTCFFLLDYLADVANRPAGKGEIVVGDDEGINPIEGTIGLT